MNYAAVIVTYNRRDKLINTLDCFNKQAHPVDYVIVVNNGSTDGTAEVLDQWKHQDVSRHIVITNENNLGGAGGFYKGLEYAQSLDIDWIWISDDDAYPDKEAIKNLDVFINTHDTESVSAICAEVISYNRIATLHRRRIRKKLFRIIEEIVPEEEYKKEFFDLDLYSYVGVIIKRTALISAGLPRKEYFIQWDDSEHSLRIGKTGRIIGVPSIRVDHDNEYSPKAGYQWKDYYLIRNRIDAIHRNLPYRYYFAMSIKKLVDMLIFKLKSDKEWASLFSSAVIDAWRGHSGVHPIYKPGWRPKKDQ